MLKSLLQKSAAKLGYEIRRRTREAETPFHPFVRDYVLPDAAFSFWITNADSASWYPQRGWDTVGEFRELRRLVRPGDRVLEIGTHHGFTAMLLANFAGGQGFVLGVEAYAPNVIVAQAQVALNGYGARMKIVHAAGAESSGGKVSLFGNHNSSVVPASAGVTDEVSTVTGDELDERYGPFDVIKIDVEGFEEKVLRGCRKLLARRPRVALELHLDSLAAYGSSRDTVLDLIPTSAYAGTATFRPDFATVHPFDRAKLPEHGIANLFLEPR